MFTAVFEERSMNVHRFVASVSLNHLVFSTQQLHKVPLLKEWNMSLCNVLSMDCTNLTLSCGLLCYFIVDV